MKKYLLLLLFSCAGKLFAQVPDDALRNSYFTPSGTARNMAAGGVMGSLGGDITASNVNPAGLGFFKTNEFVFTPGFALNNNKLAFRGSDTAYKKNAFSYGATGVIFGIPNRGNPKWTSSAFAISINQLASYNNRIAFKGKNDYSSFSEQYLEELVRDRADTNAALSNYIFGSSLAFRTYLVDTTSNAAGEFDGYRSLASIARPGVDGVIQDYNSMTSGGYHELAIAFANNMQDKLFLGMGLNIPIVYYHRELKYRESDATNNTNNDFNYFEFNEKTTSKGIGVNLKLGMIYKPKEFIRLGLALHTPSFIAFTDNIRADMTTDTEGYAGVVSESSDNLNDGNAGERQYNLITPWRAIASASYVFREVKDTRKQRAFISADIEYVNYRGARFKSNDENDLTAVDYYKSVNDKIKDYYKGAFNFRLGGELKLHTWMFRAGGAFYGNPYKQNENLKSNRIQASGGIGYRNYGFFIDLTYVHNFNKDVQFPYRLNDKANTFAQQTGSKGNVVATVGFKF